MTRLEKIIKKHNNSSNQVKEIATDKNVQGDNYRTLLPFKESQARGLFTR